MSVINRMLQDLEARRDETRSGETEQVYQDLRPVRGQHPAARRVGMLLVFGVVAAVVVVSWWMIRDRFGATTPMSVEVRKPGPMVPAPQAPASPSPAPETEVASSASLAQSAELPTAVPEKRVAPPETTAAPAHVALKPVEPSRAAPPKPALAAKAVDKPKQMASAKTPAPAAKRPVTKPTGQANATAASGIERTVKPMTPAERAEKEFTQASELLKSGRAPEAERHLVAALEADATHAQAREILVGLKLRRGDVAGAQTLLEAGITAAPAHYPFVQILARLHVDQGKDTEALAVLERNRARFAASADYLAFYAAMLQRVGRHADALQVYQQVLVLRPNDGRLWIGLGISLEAQRDATAARKAYERARATGTLDRGLDQYVEDRLRKL